MWVGGNTDTFSERRFRGRIRQASVLFVAGYSLIALRLFQLQVVRGGDLAQLSESNRTQVIFLRAPRGNFLDRDGRVLVKNRPTWSLMYSVPEKSQLSRAEVANRFAPFFKSFANTWEKRLVKAFQSKQMVRLADDVPDQVAFLMREMESLLPGVRVMMEFRRGYPMGVFAGHIMGYLGEVSERDLREEAWVARRPGDYIGKMGLEKILDDRLRGQDGGMLIEVDSVGRLKRVIKELPYQRGSSIRLTLDLDIQKVAEEELAKTETKRGAAVVIDVRTGAILAWASAPSFDPLGNLAEQIRDPKSPFLDRVYRSAYPPGSIFKIVTAIAGFEKDLIRTSDRIDCIGYVTLTDKQTNKPESEKRYRCWKKHGQVDYWKAVAESCDSYFYLLGKRVGSQAMCDYAGMFGLGTSVQDTLPMENKGHLPNPAWKKRAGLGGWSTGDTYNMAIGQGFVTSSPLQVAVLMSALATRGEIYRPYAISQVVNARGETTFNARPALWRTVTLRESTWAAITQALENVVTQGTGGASRISYLDVRGKTGTAQNPHGDDHAWFGAYAGYRNEPASVAVCVFIENGGHGGAIAAPIVRRLIETALPPKSETPNL